MISGICQIFDEIDQSAETSGSGKMRSNPSRCQPMVPDGDIPYGRPWEDRRKKRQWVHIINTCKLALNVKMAEKHQKWLSLIDDCEGLTNLLSSRGPQGGLGTFLHHLWHRETTTTSLSENPQIMAPPGLGSLMEIDQESTMRCTRAER